MCGVDPGLCYYKIAYASLCLLNNPGGLGVDWRSMTPNTLPALRHGQRVYPLHSSTCRSRQG